MCANDEVAGTASPNSHRDRSSLSAIEFVSSSLVPSDDIGVRITADGVVHQTDGFDETEILTDHKSSVGDGSNQIHLEISSSRPRSEAFDILTEGVTDLLHRNIQPPDDRISNGGDGNPASDSPHRTRDIDHKITELQRIINRMTDVFTALDTEWRIAFLNEGGRKMMCSAYEEDLTMDELEGRYFFEPIEDAEETKLWESCHTAMDRQEMVSHVTHYDGEDQEPYWIHTRVYPSETGVSIYSRDITAEKEHEQALQRQIERLDEFASILSHDLRNPLNVAQAGLELAKSDCSSEYHDDIEHGLRRMNDLIEDLLVMARQGNEIEELETIDLAQFVKRCWATVETKEATLSVTTDMAVQSESNRLARVFENLIRNAVEHVGDDVAIEVGSMVDGFYFEDDGPGIPREDRETVFDAGYSTNTNGTGFGLRIVEEIADAHGWNVAITDGSMGGTRFEFTNVRSGS